jgi:uncharacterized protein
MIAFASPFSRVFRFAFVATVVLASAQFGLASSAAHRQRTDTPPPPADLPVNLGPADAVTQYQQAAAIIFDMRSTPDYGSAIQKLRTSASQHFAPAQFLLGYLYEHGKGVTLDYRKAAENYQAAASQGHAGAENNLAALYQYGHGVPRDLNTAFKWYGASAQHGNPMAQYNLGTFYRLGYATSPDPVRAAECFRAAAEQGLAIAQANLAIFYFKGTGVPIDNVQAAHYALLAAQQGLPHAAMNYAYMCEHGLGLSRNDLAAYVWYSRATAFGDKSAASHAKSIAHHLSRTDLEEANSQLAADASHPQQPVSMGADSDVALIEKP